jgi:hypothetical protein
VFENESAGVTVLGTELAAAAAAERRRVPTGPSPIAHVRYPPRAGDLWRWVEQPADATMSEFVSAYAAADGQSQGRTRASLTMRDLYTLLLFARRRGFAAIRTGDPAAAAEAYDALSAIDIERVDWRDVWSAAMLAGYAASRAGAPVAADAAVGRADPRVAEILSRAAVAKVDLSKACGYRVVPASDGLVLFDDGYKRYEPDRDLVPIALGIAAAIEHDGTYRVDGLGICQGIPPFWAAADTDRRVAAAIEQLTGCASVHATPIDGPPTGMYDHFLSARLAEAATVEDATTIAQKANRSRRSGTTAMAVTAGRLCAVFVAACALADQPSRETAETLARFQPTVMALLG